LESGDPAGAPRIERVPVATIRLNPKNARTHSRKQIRQIAASIRKFGFLNPLILDEGNMILAGHGRLEAARLEGMAHVPIVRFDHLSDAKAMKLLLALVDRYAETTESKVQLGELLAEDQAILAQYLLKTGPGEIGEQVNSEGEGDGD
jgi:ParB-like nuclease domain